MQMKLHRHDSAAMPSAIDDMAMHVLRCRAVPKQNPIPVMAAYAMNSALMVTAK
jgi:hypothetical protein